MGSYGTHESGGGVGSCLASRGTDSALIDFTEKITCCVIMGVMRTGGMRVA